MTHTRFTWLLSRKKAVRYLIYLLLVCVFAVFVFRLNQVEKTELVVRTGQTFEKGKITEILQDNLDSNGTRVGEQKVRVKMLTGVRKEEELDVTSSSGYLFGAACTVGMKVIVMQSVAVRPRLPAFTLRIVNGLFTSLPFFISLHCASSAVNRGSKDVLA